MASKSSWDPTANLDMFEIIARDISNLPRGAFSKDEHKLDKMEKLLGDLSVWLENLKNNDKAELTFPLSQMKILAEASLMAPSKYGKSIKKIEGFWEKINNSKKTLEREFKFYEMEKKRQGDALASRQKQKDKIARTLDTANLTVRFLKEEVAACEEGLKTKEFYDSTMRSLNLIGIKLKSLFDAESMKPAGARYIEEDKMKELDALIAHLTIFPNDKRWHSIKKPEIEQFYRADVAKFIKEVSEFTEYFDRSSYLKFKEQRLEELRRGEALLKPFEPADEANVQEEGAVRGPPMDGEVEEEPQEEGAVRGPQINAEVEEEPQEEGAVKGPPGGPQMEGEGEPEEVEQGERGGEKVIEGQIEVQEEGPEGIPEGDKKL